MKNYGKKVMCLIFVTVVVLWTLYVAAVAERRADRAG